MSPFQTKRNVAVTATNMNVAYLSYVPLVAKSFQLFTDAQVVLGIVTHENHFPKVLDVLESYCRIVPIAPEVGVDSGVQAKYSRLQIATMSEFSDVRVSIADLDLVQLSDARWSALSGLSGEALIRWGFDHPSYNLEANRGKWPMDGTTALGRVFKDIVNPDGLSNSELIQQWSEFSIDGREGVFLSFTDFSDESLLRSLAVRRPHPFQEVSRRNMEDKPMASRLDRSDRFHFFLKRKLKSGFYTEMHGFRPFNPNSYVGRAVLEHLQIPHKDYLEFDKQLVFLLREGS